MIYYKKIGTVTIEVHNIAYINNDKYIS
jgi:hypothetical protein